MPTLTNPLSTVPVSPHSVISLDVLLEGYTSLIDAIRSGSAGPFRLDTMLLRNLLEYASYISPSLWDVDGWDAPAFTRPITDVIPNLQVCHLLHARGIQTMADLIYWRSIDLQSVTGIGRKRALYIQWCEVAAGYQPPLFMDDVPRNIPGEYVGAGWRSVPYPPGCRPRFGQYWRWVPQAQLHRLPLIDMTYGSTAEDQPDTAVPLGAICRWLASHGICRVEDMTSLGTPALQRKLQAALRSERRHPPVDPVVQLSAQEIINRLTALLPEHVQLGPSS